MSYPSCSSVHLDVATLYIHCRAGRVLHALVINEGYLRMLGSAETTCLEDRMLAVLATSRYGVNP
eukprot:COSAG02_NODE_2696_length_8213_cov_87.332388_2_plen_65_part_00